MYSPQIALPLLLVIVSPSVFADQAAFKNGDRLTGAILKSDAKSLLMTTAVAGEVTVSWQEIQELRSDLPLHVVLANGKKLVGRMKTREGKVKIVTDTGDTVEASKESVVVLRNNAEQLAYEKSQHGSLLHGWDGGLDAGWKSRKPAVSGVPIRSGSCPPAAKFDHPLPHPYPAGPKVPRAFVTTAASRLAESVDALPQDDGEPQAMSGRHT